MRSLSYWRAATWTDIRGDCRDKLSRQFLPDTLLERIAQKAHICTTVERLRRVIGSSGWPYLDKHGEDLVEYLAIATTAFDEIFKLRKQTAAASAATSPSEDADVIMEDVVESSGSAGEETSIAEVTNVAPTRLRLKLTIPSKRSTTSDSSTYSKSKRQCREKENE